MPKLYPPKPSNPDLIEVPLTELGLDRDQTVKLRSERGTFRVKHATRSIKSGAMWVTLYGGRPGYGAFRSVGMDKVVVIKRKRVEK